MGNLSYSMQELEAAIKCSKSWSDTLGNLGLSYCSAMVDRARNYADINGFDYSHFGGGGTSKRWTLEEILVENSKFPKNSSYRLKERLWKENILKKECSICGIKDIWNNICGTDHLEIDHINGIGSDNRLENLRILCSNCHSYTETNCGRNINK